MGKEKKWKPVVGQNYYFITFDEETRQFQCDEEVLESCDNNEFDMPIFSSEEECLGMCSYLNGLMAEKKQESDEFIDDFITVGELREMTEHLRDKDFITVNQTRSGIAGYKKIQCVEDSTAVGFWEIRI